LQFSSPVVVVVAAAKPVLVVVVVGFKACFAIPKLLKDWKLLMKCS
jgi:hypothetical protein